MPWRQPSGPTKTERIVAGLSYLTMGMTGLVYILFSKRDNQSTVFRFHAYQSIFLAILGILIKTGLPPLFELIEQFSSLASHDLALGLATGFDFLVKGLLLVELCVILYGAVMAFLGKFTKIPFVSDLIHRNMPA